MIDLFSKLRFSRIVLCVISFTSVLLTTACSNDSVVDMGENNVSEEISHQFSTINTVIYEPESRSEEIPKKEPNSTHELLESYITTA